LSAFSVGIQLIIFLNLLSLFIKKYIIMGHKRAKWKLKYIICKINGLIGMQKHMKEIKGLTGLRQ